jgi:hypothetical protein
VAKIAIYNAISGAFSLYCKNLLLLVSLGALAGFISWGSLVGPRHLAQKMGMSQEKVITIQDGSNVNDVINRVSFKISSYMDTTDKSSLFIIFVTMVALWLLTMFVHLGIIKVALQIIDKGTSSFTTFLSVKQYLLTYIGSSLLFGLYSLVILVGSSLVIVPMFIIIAKIAHLSAWTALIVMPLVMFGVFGYLLRYVLFSYCIIDKNADAREALMMSATITQDQRMALLGFFFVLFGLFFVGFSLIKVAFGVHTSQATVHSMLYMIGMATVVTPLSILMISRLYRQLTSK